MRFQPLYRWYQQHKRDLPFRGTGDLYKVWLSEVMLQQTRVAAMLPVYERFLSLFPDMERLASAREEEVLAAWRGLGYYSRARNLWRGVRTVVEEYAGLFPPDYSEALKIPGVGPYTASAILSIHYNLPFPVLDGNVRRVLWRLFGEDANRIFETKELESIAEEWMQKRGGTSAGDHNQALMELGALVCIPGRPGCEACPMRKDCGAYRSGGPLYAAGLPPSRRKEQIEKTLEIYLLLEPVAEEIWIVRDPKARFFSNSPFFPFREMEGGKGKMGEGAISFLRSTPGLREILAKVPEKKIGVYAGEFRHQITHHRIRLRARWVLLDRKMLRNLELCAASALDEGVLWEAVPLSSLRERVVSSIAGKIEPALREAVGGGFGSYQSPGQMKRGRRRD